MLNLILMLLWAASGFFLGALIIGAIPALRAHPRYLMTAGAVVMPLLWALHVVVPARPLLFGPDLLLMMAGVGAFLAGWEAEAEIEEQLIDERRKRLRAAWESRQAHSVESTEPEAGHSEIATSAKTPADVDGNLS